MPSLENPSWLSRFLGNYFNKRVFPYWCVVLADTVIEDAGDCTRTAKVLSALEKACRAQLS